MKHFKVHLWSSENWNKHRNLFNYLWLWDLFCGNHSTQSTCSYCSLCPDPIRHHRLSPLSGSVLQLESQQNSNLGSIRDGCSNKRASPQTSHLAGIILLIWLKWTRTEKKEKKKKKRHFSEDRTEGLLFLQEENLTPQTSCYPS